MNEDNSVTVLDLLNLSLGTPEIGAVNFNLLHRFLLELIKHLSIAGEEIDVTDDLAVERALKETRKLSSGHSHIQLVYDDHKTESMSPEDSKNAEPCTSSSDVTNSISGDEERQKLPIIGEEEMTMQQDMEGAKGEDEENDHRDRKNSKETTSHGNAEVVKSDNKTDANSYGLSRRPSSISSNKGVRKQSIPVTVPGLHQLERKMSILEAKFESLSSAPRNLETANEIQNEESKTTAAGNSRQVTNLVRRIEVIEGTIGGITASLDDVKKQLKKIKDFNFEEKFKDIFQKLNQKPSVVQKMEESSDEKFKKVSENFNRKPGVVNTMGESFDEIKIKLSKLDEKLKNVLYKSDLKEYVTGEKMKETLERRLQNYSPTKSAVRDSAEIPSDTESVATKSATPNTNSVDNNETALSEVGDDEGKVYGGKENIGNMPSEASEEFYNTMSDFCKKTERKIRELEKCLSNTGNNRHSSTEHFEKELKNIRDVQSSLQNSQKKIENDLNNLLENPSHYTHAASQNIPSELNNSTEDRLQSMAENLLEMKQRLFGLNDIKETIRNLKESEDIVRSDVDNVHTELAKIMKYFEEEQGRRKTVPSVVGHRLSTAAVDNEDLHKIRSSLHDVKNEIDKHHVAMLQLMDDQNKKQLHLDALYDHVAHLEKMKADTQEINLEIKAKADRRDMEDKVSQDKFHNSLSTLDQSVQDLVEKLVGHEATLKQAINHITLDVNSKLDKMDMDTVKDYFEEKLKDLNSKVKQKSNTDKAQAAASRTWLIQPANCISCDRPVHLYREGTKLPSLPLNKPLPQGKSYRPYMSLDLNDFRSKMHALQYENKKNESDSLGVANVQNELLKLRAIKEVDDFAEISSRPCGGNHTLTCPEKRTTIRVNKAYREDLHFIAQLSQKDLSIVDILGYDGHVYKGQVNQLPSIPEIPKRSIATRPTTGSNRQCNSSPT